MKLRNILTMAIYIFLLLSIGCAGQGKNSLSRTVQDELAPYFTSVNWPAPYTVLPEGRLVITGTLQCPSGFFEELPIGVYMFPVSFIEPPLPGATITQEELQQLLEANPTVQGWVDEIRATLFRRVTTGPFVGADKWQDFTTGLQSRGLFSEGFDEYNYLDFQTGDFRFDFDETARLNPGDVLLMVDGIDQNGQICLAMNIYSIGSIDPGILTEEDTAAIAFANRIVGLGNALIEVLAVSGDDRSVDIGLIHPFLTLLTEAYGDGYHQWEWDTAAANLRETAIAPAASITDPTYKAIYEAVVSFVAETYEYDYFKYWGNHFVEIPPGVDLNQRHEEAVQYFIDWFNEYNESYVITEGGGVKELSVQINHEGELIAQFTVIGNPNSALVVLGFIGEHNIVPEDYNPCFVDIFGVFSSERFAWPPYGI